jgi:hypothetical protein
VRFGAVRPVAAVERALQLPVREAIQQEADEARMEICLHAQKRRAVDGRTRAADIGEEKKVRDPFAGHREKTIPSLTGTRRPVPMSSTRELRFS